MLQCIDDCLWIIKHCDIKELILVAFYGLLAEMRPLIGWIIPW